MIETSSNSVQRGFSRSESKFESSSSQLHPITRRPKSGNLKKMSLDHVRFLFKVEMERYNRIMFYFKTLYVGKGRGKFISRKRSKKIDNFVKWCRAKKPKKGVNVMYLFNRGKINAKAPYLSYKFSAGGWWVKSDFSVSLCPFFNF